MLRFARNSPTASTFTDAASRDLRRTPAAAPRAAGFGFADAFAEAAPTRAPVELSPPPPVGAIEDFEAAAPKLDAQKIGVVLNDHVNNLPSAAELSELGATGVRVTLTKDNYVPEDPENMAAWETRLRDWHDNGIHVLANLPAELVSDFPTPPHRDGGYVAALQDDAWYHEFMLYSDRYAGAAEGISSRFGGLIDGYEIWNEPDEPNNRDDYAPGLPAGKFGELLQRAYETVKTFDPDSTVVSGGADSGQTDYLLEAAAATGGRLYADAIGLHPYGKDPNADPSDPSSLAQIAANYESALGLPLYITEASTPDPTLHETYIPDFARAADGMGSIAKSYFFWKKTYDEHPGLVSQDGAPAAAYASLRELIR